MINYIFCLKIASFAIVSILSLSCQKSIIRQLKQTQAAAQQKPQPNLTYGDLVIKEQLDHILIPVSLADRDVDKESYYDSSRSNSGINQYINIIFYSKKDSKTHLLLNKKAIVTAFELLPHKQEKNPFRFWFYQIIDSDINGDKKLDYQDARIAYLSDLSGKNVQQITPNNTQVMNWTVVPSVDAIFIKILKDSDNDKKFTDKDETNFIKVNLDKPGIGTEIISDEIQQQIKSLFLQ
ncbi:hypothetical protein QUB80_23805 [Chlorogloeopsis sp. ULAP01]|uniref:hypothetical protein n=1 Tax=Chlorogloeopsis sp. ULAP01 TaxID=3056483 RepID=UPI0025AA9FE2|nr:hypothetical protein [Chlorogloeopsis sp. ULAP01]MDM9383714.1 hypothetical protein [Chlorogloeopsis sp. ULAP01]